MKKHFIFFLLVFLITACGKNKNPEADLAAQKITDYIVGIDSANLAAYKFIDNTVVDTMTFLETVDGLLEELERRFDAFANSLKADSTRLVELEAANNQEEIQKLNRRLASLSRVNAKDRLRIDLLNSVRDSLAGSQNPNNISALVYKHICEMQSTSMDEAQEYTFYLLMGRDQEVIDFKPSREALKGETYFPGIEAFKAIR